MYVPAHFRTDRPGFRTCFLLWALHGWANASRKSLTDTYIRHTDREINGRSKRGILLPIPCHEGI